jgi:hypothetical protein
MGSNARLYQGQTYRQLQARNKTLRGELTPEQRQQLKNDGYKNIGWHQVISLYEKLLELSVGDLTLESLFIDADRIGNKYQTQEEINAFNEQLAQINNEIAAEMDRYFPDTDEKIEVIHFR